MKRINRRALLRGAGGIALGLPLLNAMLEGRASAQVQPAPKRIIFVFKPNGDQINRRFTAAGETSFQFDEFLQPLEPYRNELLILNRLDKRHDKLPVEQMADGHQQGGSSLSPWPSGQGSFPIGGADRKIGYVLGPSADYEIGGRVLQQNPGVKYRHLVYRVGQKNNDIWNLHSHAGPVGQQNPVPPETDPYKAYARIFSFVDPTDQKARDIALRQLRMKKSALDLILSEANSLRSRLGPEDRQKLEQHLEALRDIERTLQTGTTTVACKALDLGTPINAYDDANHQILGHLFFKIIAMAFACDLSRVVNFNWSGNTSNRVYANLGLSEGHHDISHDSSEVAFTNVRKIHKHLWTASTQLYKELKAIPEGNGTLWDNTLIVHWNELAQGDTHAKRDEMVILTGGTQGYFRRGRLIDFKNKASFSDMLVSCFQAMGFEDVIQFGDQRLATGGPLPGLT